ncbi:hypothetical protein THFILI_00075 [Thermus filiformis]|uniref:Uncharacterized protein n=1 Tax=Thermus filiformis TaxID=276 RepID=A0A0D6XA96_THEFI|nr:hypothetical protein THFILI_00075 [Thermus filiformis]
MHEPGAGLLRLLKGLRSPGGQGGLLHPSPPRGCPLLGLLEGQGGQGGLPAGRPVLLRGSLPLRDPALQEPQKRLGDLLAFGLLPLSVLSQEL